MACLLLHIYIVVHTVIYTVVLTCLPGGSYKHAWWPSCLSPYTSMFTVPYFDAGVRPVLRCYLPLRLRHCRSLQHTALWPCLAGRLSAGAGTCCGGSIVPGGGRSRQRGGVSAPLAVARPLSELSMCDAHMWHCVAAMGQRLWSCDARENSCPPLSLSHTAGGVSQAACASATSRHRGESSEQPQALEGAYTLAGAVEMCDAAKLRLLSGPSSPSPA